MPFHHKKPFDPSGDVYANSVTRTMKSQALSAWDMFTRETLQNSWDARDRASHDDGVTFAIDFVELNQHQIDCLKNDVFGNDFVGIPQLESALESGSLSALTVSDSGTYGLRGPSIATAAVDGPTDFNSFVRNIGRSDTKKVAGGTYGFGKGVFFIASEVKTIVVYTRTIDENGQRVNRLIAMSNADDFQADNIAYTGRHWWGEHAVEETGTDRTEFAEPYTGQIADAIAAVLGLDSYFTEDRQTGTSIMILNPDLSVQEDQVKSGLDSGRIVLQQIASSLTRWAWPHMIDIDTGMDPIEFSVSYKREQMKIPDPKKDQGLRPFVMAYSEAVSNPKPPSNVWNNSYFGRLTTISGKRPKKDLGTLAIVSLNDAISSEQTVIGQDISNHVATLRNPRMVVEYYQAPEAANGKPYCGVFLADPEADRVFARSEPAAHHQWNRETIAHDVELLKEFWGSTNNPVSVFFTRLREMLQSVGLENARPTRSQHFRSAAELSSSLGTLISNAEGGTSNRYIKPKLKTVQRKKSSSRATANSEIDSIRKAEGGKHTTFSVDVQIPSNKLPAGLTIQPAVNSDKGDLYQQLSKLGVPVPKIEKIAFTADEENTASNALASADAPILLESPEASLLVDVWQPNDTAVSLRFEFEYNLKPNSIVIGESTDE